MFQDMRASIVGDIEKGTRPFSPYPSSSMTTNGPMANTFGNQSHTSKVTIYLPATYVVDVPNKRAR